MTVTHDQQFEHEKWSSESVFLLAAIGGAVGLGNLWRFPFLAGQNGGGAFVLIYIGFVFLLCLPLVIAELAMGRRGRGSAITTMHKLTAEANASSIWHIIGWVSVILPLLALGYYSVVAGWSIDYVGKAALNSFENMSGEESNAVFEALSGSPVRVLALHALFISGAIFVVARGLGKGIEVLMKFMMPGLFILLIVLALNSIFRLDIEAGLTFLFNPDFSKITTEVVLMALGQAFFSIAVGVGMLLTYGAYLPKEVPLARAALWIIGADTLVALLAGIIIFPIVFSNGLDPAVGPRLIFVTLPVAFGNMPGGYLVGLLFFIMLFFAAFSTVIAMLEPAVSWLEEKKGMSRVKVTFAAGGFGWMVGIAAALSFNVLSHVRLFPSIDLLSDKSIFDIVDFFVATLGIPFNAALLSLFAGWVMSRSALMDEMQVRNPLIIGYMRFTLRYIAPVVIGAIFVESLLGISIVDLWNRLFFLIG
jgi:NSS family neurotransmitter:Na+ symporter